MQYELSLNIESKQRCNYLPTINFFFRNNYPQVKRKEIFRGNKKYFIPS